MTEPTTPTGKRVAARPDVGGNRLLSLKELRAIEHEAIEPLIADAACWREAYERNAALADQLAEALRCYMGIGPLDDDQRVAARHALAAYEEARR